MSEATCWNGSANQPVWQLGAHIPQLDGVRGLAILLVTLYRFGKDMPTDTWFGKLLAMQLWAGEHGVELFFVLSGFLITGILLDTKQNKNYFSSFIGRRSLRIFPLYFGALFLFLWLIPALLSTIGFEHPFGQAQSNQIYLWSYLSNVHMSLEDSWCFGSLDHFWSLAVEEHFYLVWPLVVYCLAPKNSFRLAIVLACVCSSARIGWSSLQISEVAPSVLTVFRCDALFLGAILAHLARSPQGLPAWRTVAVWSLPVMLIAGLLIDYSGRRFLTVGLSVWPLVWASMMILLLTANVNSLAARAFKQPWLLSLGRTSYAMYVFQSPLIPLMTPVAAWIGAHALVINGVSGHLVWMASMFALTYALAWLSWHTYEKHWLGLKRLFPVGSASRVERSIDGHPQVASSCAVS